MHRMGVDPPTRRARCSTPTQLVELQAAADGVFVHHAVVDYAVRLVLATRDAERVRPAPTSRRCIALGASPRGHARAGRRRPRARAAARPRRTCCPRTSSTSRPRCCATGSCSRYEALADGVDGRRTLARPRARARSAPPRVAPRQDRPTAAPPASRRRLPRRVTARRRAHRVPTSRGRHRGRARAAPARARRSRAASTACCRATTSGSCPGPAPSRARPRRTSPVTTSAASTGTSPPAPTCPTSATPIADRELETWMVVDRSASLDFGTARVREARPRPRRGAARRLPHRPHRQPVGASCSPATAPSSCPRARSRRAPAPLLHRVDGAAPAGRPASRRADLRSALARAGAAAPPPRPGRGHLRLPRPLRLGSRRCARFGSATTCSRSRSSTRASSSSRGRHARRSSTPRPAAAWRCRPRASSVRERYAEAAARRRAEIASDIRGAGAEHVVLRTDRDWLLDLAQYVVTRKRAPRRAGGAAMSFLAGSRLAAAPASSSASRSAYMLVQRQRRQYAVRFTNVDLLASVAPRGRGGGATSRPRACCSRWCSSSWRSRSRLAPSQVPR